MGKNNDHTEFEILTGKYLAGEVSPEEITELEALVSSSEENKKLFLDLKHAWQASHAGQYSFSKEKAWGVIEQSIFGNEKEIPAIELPVEKTRMRPVWRYAAVISVLIAVGFLLFFLFHNPDKELVATNSVISTTLEDGSEITLNRQTKLIYPKKFSEDERRVKLEGDAFFEISRDEQKPFIIETGDVHVKVLGTSFYVDARAVSQIVEVVVTSGKVAMIDASGKQIELTKGEKGIFNKDEQTLKEINSGDENYLAWKTGKIRFEDTPLAQVAEVLDRTYHVHITLQNRILENCRLTATFNHQSLEDVLLIIKETLDLKVNRTANAIILSGNGCE